jgi:lysophospholipase L1-like esterase
MCNMNASIRNSIVSRLPSWILGFAALAWFCTSVHAHDQKPWVATWGSSPVGLPTVAKIGAYSLSPPITIHGTIRYRLRISQGGSRLRIRFSNEYGEVPLTISAATVGLAGGGLDVLHGSFRRAMFAGRGAITIPAGAPALSDPIYLPVKPLTDLIVSVYAPSGLAIFVSTEEASTFDPAVVDNSDATLVERLPKPINQWIRPMVTLVTALADHSRKVIVAFGDSITEGVVDRVTGERGWPGALARRLERRGIAVVNAGIGGNRLLQSYGFFGTSALSRMDRDVFSVPGLTDIVVLEGINDIGMSGKGGLFGDAPLVAPEELIAAYSQIIARAHVSGVRVFGGTILPFQGADYYSEKKEHVRQTVNTWIRTAKAFDGFIDFEAALRDPSNPSILKAEFDSGDHLHPNSAGYRQMGEMVDLRLFD